MKLTNRESKDKDGFANQLREKRTDLEAAVQAAQSAIEDALTELNAEIAKFNEVVSETKSFVEGMKDSWQSEYDGKSEKWQESEKGVAAMTLIEEWDNAVSEFEEIEEVSVDVEMPEGGESYADDLDALASESEE